VTRLHRNMNVAGVVVSFAAFLAAVPMLWNDLIGWGDLAILAALYLLSGIGITVGFHRLLTDRAFETYRAVRYAFAVLGSIAVQGPVIGWVADHRKHHAFTDEDGDPHSPHVGHEGRDGWRGALRGLWHAHAGWLFEYDSGEGAERHAPDPLEDRGSTEDRSTNVFWFSLISLASPGTTTTTPSRARPGTGCAGGRSTPAAC
jgi:stearoyl-CoA desaturase (delta-9 desaturase)